VPTKCEAYDISVPATAAFPILTSFYCCASNTAFFLLLLFTSLSMPLFNQTKPSYSITNQTKPSYSITNQTKPYSITTCLSMSCSHGRSTKQNHLIPSPTKQNHFPSPLVSPCHVFTGGQPNKTILLHHQPNKTILFHHQPNITISHHNLSLHVMFPRAVISPGLIAVCTSLHIILPLWHCVCVCLCVVCVYVSIVCVRMCIVCVCLCVVCVCVHCVCTYVHCVCIVCVHALSLIVCVCVCTVCMCVCDFFTLVPSASRSLCVCQPHICSICLHGSCMS
jgi:hypothetical protein